MENTSIATEIKGKTQPSPSTPAKFLKRHLWSILFITPAVIIFILFLWFPIARGIIYSFYQIDFVNGNTFIGLDNYMAIFNDRLLGTVIKNTLYYMLLGIIMGFWVPLVFAIFISELRRFQGVVRVIAYLPNIIPVVVLYSLWRWLYDPVGPINGFLVGLGLEEINFLVDSSWSMISIVFMETWQQFGAGMLIYLAAILSIPKDWYEAAEIDGASIWQRVRYITLPSIKNVLMLMFVLQLIWTSQGYLSQMAMLDGGPNNATRTYVLNIVKNAFERQDYGVASALGVLMFFALVGLAIIQNRLSKKKEG